MVRGIILALLAAALAVLAVIRWGSVGSAVCLYGLIMMGAALLIKHFLVDRDSGKFDSE